jgi:hypothetical protein
MLLSPDRDGLTLTSSNDVEKLQVDLQCAKALLLHTPLSPLRTASHVSFTSAKTALSIRALKPPLPKVLLSRMTAPFRRARARSQQNKYDKMEETKSLLSDRRGSADSDTTLIEDSLFSDLEPVPTGPSGAPDAAGQILEILAPIIGSLQRLTPRLETVQHDGAKLSHDLDALCEQTLDLLDELTEKTSTRGPYKDEHDLEMTSLMLDALRKKVEKEQMSMQRSSSLEVDYTETEHTDSDGEDERARQVIDRREVNSGPLLPASRNPFIVHSTSIALSSTRRSSVTGKAVPIGMGPSTAFAGNQQSWTQNVIRLGSFQNSMLFSPSPVAVRPNAMITRPYQPLHMPVD